jgi:hypothetical protein
VVYVLEGGHVVATGDGHQPHLRGIEFADERGSAASTRLAARKVKKAAAASAPLRMRM